MKRLKYLLTVLIAALMFIPFTHAAENVVIKSVTLVDKSDSAEVLNEATFSGLNVNFDLKFVNVEDFAQYQIVLKNNSKKEYEVELSDLTNEHMEYKYNVGKNVVIKANSELTLNLTITYKTAVTEQELTDGAYVENKEFTISLSGEENPKTGDINIAIIVIILIAIFGFLYYKVDSKQTQFSLGIVLALLLVPLTIFAAERLTVKINSKVTISEDISFYVLYSSACPESNPGKSVTNNDTFEATEDGKCLYKYNAKQGMTFDNFFDEYELNYPFALENIYYEEFSTTSIVGTDPIINSHVYYYHIMEKIIINEREYKAIKGMTIDEWIHSPLNTDNITFEDGSNVSCESGVTYLYEIPTAIKNTFKSPALKSDGDDIEFNNMINYDTVITGEMVLNTVTVTGEQANNCEYKTVTINNKEYQFIDGMTWYQWINTKYNTDELGINKENYECYYYNIINSNNTYIYDNTLMVEGTYTLTDDHGCNSSK